MVDSVVAVVVKLYMSHEMWNAYFSTTTTRRREELDSSNACPRDKRNRETVVNNRARPRKLVSLFGRAIVCVCVVGHGCGSCY